MVLVVFFGIFVMGLLHQKANLSLFPSEGLGLVFNGVFLGCLLVVLYMLSQFFLNWSFLATVKYFILSILPLSLAANYAFINIKKN